MKKRIKSLHQEHIGTTGQIAEIELTADEEALLVKHGSSKEQFIANPYPSFVVVDNEAEADELHTVCEKLDPLRFATTPKCIKFAVFDITSV